MHNAAFLLLLQPRLDHNLRDSEGNTPLSYALENNNSECISIILNRFEKHSFLVTCKDVNLLLQSKHPGMHYLFRHCCFNYTYLNATP